MTIPSNKPRGAVMIEFALTVLIFAIAMLAVIELSRAMFVWNTSAEATRRAARLASICEPTLTQQNIIREKVKIFVQSSGQITLGPGGDWLQFTYLPAGCDACESGSNCTSGLLCRQVEAKLSGLSFELMIPITALSISLPEHRVRVVRESMRNAISGDPNSSCN
jgi:hypothetical protein